MTALWRGHVIFARPVMYAVISRANAKMPEPNIGETAATTREKPMAYHHHPPKARARLRRLLASQSVDVPGASPVSPGKASEILEHGTVHGKALTGKQKQLFRAVSHGWKPARLT